LEKAWLSEQGIEFEDRDITRDPKALDELQELGFFTTPVTLIGMDIVVGFDRKKLQALLGFE